MRRLAPLILSACTLVPDPTGPLGTSGQEPPQEDASTTSAAMGSTSQDGSSTGAAEDSTGSSTGDPGTTGESTTIQESTGTEPAACEPIPAPYEACEPACAPFPCGPLGVCLEPAGGPDLPFCSANCTADPDCPASPHGAYPASCALGLCWLACTDDPRKPCPFGYQCWDPGPDVQRPVCLPE